jgi:hypothetical protein
MMPYWGERFIVVFQAHLFPNHGSYGIILEHHSYLYCEKGDSSSPCFSLHCNVTICKEKSYIYRVDFSLGGGFTVGCSM